MYDIGDEDLANAYDPKKVAGAARIPKMPKVDGAFEHELLTVKKDRTPQAGNQYVFKFKTIKSNNELVLEGKTYELKYYPGKSDVDYSKFWNKVTPLLMAITGQNNIDTFNAGQELGELMKMCKEDESLVLGLRFKHVQVLEEARPDKDTGKVDPKFLEKDGVTPVKFVRHEFAPGSATA